MFVYGAAAAAAFVAGPVIGPLQPQQLLLLVAAEAVAPAAAAAVAVALAAAAGVAAGPVAVIAAADQKTTWNRKQSLSTWP